MPMAAYRPDITSDGRRRQRSATARASASRACGMRAKPVQIAELRLVGKALTMALAGKVDN